MPEGIKGLNVFSFINVGKRNIPIMYKCRAFFSLYVYSSLILLFLAIFLGHINQSSSTFSTFPKQREKPPNFFASLHLQRESESEEREKNSIKKIPGIYAISKSIRIP